MKLTYKPINGSSGIVTDEFGNEYKARFTNCQQGLTLYTMDTDSVITTVPLQGIHILKPHEGAPFADRRPDDETLDTAGAALSSLLRRQAI